MKLIAWFVCWPMLALLVVLAPFCAAFDLIDIAIERLQDYAEAE